MKEKIDQPQFAGLETVQEIKKPKRNVEPRQPDSHLNAEILRLISNGSTYDEAKKEASLRLYGTAVLETLDDSIFPDPSLKDDAETSNEALVDAFFSRGSKLEHPIDFIEQIYNIHSLVGDELDYKSKIGIVDGFKKIIQKTTKSYNMYSELRYRGFNNIMTTQEFEVYKSKTHDSIKKMEDQQINLYRRVFPINKLAKLGIIKDKDQINELLRSDTVAIIHLLRDESNPNFIDKNKQKQYINQIDKYLNSLKQEELRTSTSDIIDE
jgi:hypothetical protein